MQQQPRAKLTAAQWQRLEPLPPGKPADPGRAGFNNRKTVAGILWIDRAGAPWRDRPPCFGQGNTIHRRFRRWVKGGVFARLLDALPEDLDLRLVMVDGTFAKVHQHGAGAEKGAAPPSKAGKPKLSAKAGAD